uniref:Cholinergic receptor, nicotinic, alpha 10b n=1 Tax=Paramormyrops kingsleyae TaxID=1676925 RepID=A0A3B3T396_9TELE
GGLSAHQASCLGAHGKYAHKLLNDLFAKYSRALRPVQDTDDVINVTLQITVSQIIDMDQRNQILTTYLWIRQVWIDAFLTWKKEDYDGLDAICIPSSYVWRPDIVLYNKYVVLVMGPAFQVYCHWGSPAITKSSCKVDIYFPFDSQKCPLTYGSWTHNGNQMDLHKLLDSADLSDFVENVKWVVFRMPAKKNLILYGCCSDPYPDITYTMHLKRRCLLLHLQSKVSLGVTVLLSLTVFQLLVAEIMPPSESIPLIGKYYITTMTMITASTALSIFIMNIHHCGLEAKPVPPWTRKFILEYLARICFVYDIGENCMTAQSDMAEPPSPAGEPVGEPGGLQYSLFVPSATAPKNIEYIATFCRDQRANQKRTGEWRKVAKVMDCFFMWIFFIMVFLMSVLVICKAI